MMYHGVNILFVIYKRGEVQRIINMCVSLNYRFVRWGYRVCALREVNDGIEQQLRNASVQLLLQ